MSNVNITSPRAALGHSHGTNVYRKWAAEADKAAAETDRGIWSVSLWLILLAIAPGRMRSTAGISEPSA